MTAWDKLSGLFPWPSVHPTTHCLVSGWTTEEKQWEFLLGRLREDAVILEVGAWTGKTSLHILGLWPRTRLIAVDAWTESPVALSHYWREWRAEGKMADGDTPKSLYLTNLWDYRERVIAIQADSVAGMLAVADSGMAPDLIYIDADHGEAAVYRDVTVAVTRFPQSLISGHDYLTNAGDENCGVARAVKRCGIEHGKKVGNMGKVWWYE